MATATAAALLAGRKTPGTEDVEVPGVGTVTIRSLSRRESAEVVEKEMPLPEMEIAMLRLGLVAPVLTDDELAQWYDGADSGDVGLVVNAIVRLSGLAVHADREAMSRFRQRSGS